MIEVVRSIRKMVPMIFVMGTIFFLSHQPGTKLYSVEFPGADKIAHLGIYALLAGTVFYAIPLKIKERKSFLGVFIVVAVCTLYGLTDEYHQSFVPGRYPSGYDLLADVAGAVLFAGIWLAVTKRSRP